MDRTLHLILESWQNFYVIVGTSAGALTGLQFVVITLISESRAASNMRDIRAFGTPTVIHFCTALLVSAFMTAPWRSLESFGICLGLCGAAGVIYSLNTFRHARKATYKPDLEDWIWYTATPFISHVALVAAAILLPWNIGSCLIIVAADALFFVLLGVRNAWDTVTYIAVRRARHAASAETREQAGKDIE